MSKLRRVRSHHQQPEVALALVSLLYAMAAFALISATVLDIQNDTIRILSFVGSGCAFAWGTFALFTPMKLSRGFVAVVGCSSIVLMLLLTAIGSNPIRSAANGLMIVAMIMLIAWFMPVWFARVVAYSGLGLYAVLIITQFPASDVWLLVLLLVILAGLQIEVVGRFQRNLENSMLTDHLCKVWNRAGLQLMLEREIQLFAREARPLSLLFIDLDGFKVVNDQYGHLAGDNVLFETAQALELSVRPTDTVARIGGDEFVVLLPGTTAAEARMLADRLHTEVTVSAWSFGVAEYRVGESASEFMDRSDKELIASKKTLLHARESTLPTSLQRFVAARQDALRWNSVQQAEGQTIAEA